MPHLMHGRLPLIIPIHRIRHAGHAPREDIAPVVDVAAGGVFDGGVPVRDGGGEGAVAEEDGGAGGVGVGREVRLEVEV